ncbi:MAG: SURF1 family protein, partial [Sphingomonadaceae bacterium]|nr:SURF1 family protein [Sphingomonadaceae bacterium]
MKRLPLIPTLLVAAAMGVMIWLGIWQLQRLGEKQALLANYRAAESLPETAWPATPDRALIFRRARGFCLAPVSWRAKSGRNRAGGSGWSHIAACR